MYITVNAVYVIFWWGLWKEDADFGVGFGGNTLHDMAPQPTGSVLLCLVSRGPALA